MLRSPMALCLCSSFFLLPMSITRGKSSLAAYAVHVSDDHGEIVMRKTNTLSAKMKMNRQGMQFTKSYIRRSKGDLARIKRISTIPFSIIDSVFSVYHLPRELRYLAVIESELKPSALSRVGALGPWQLMPETAHILGLKTGARHDERKDYYKSTRAAARYLKDLHASFGDWLLVIAAYNGGPAPVNAAISRSGSRNFWVLQRYLPAESREHVKKFIATTYYFEGAGTLPEKGTGSATTGKAVAPAQAVSATGIKSPTAAPLNETEDQKFRRLMDESAASLRRSELLLQ